MISFALFLLSGIAIIVLMLSKKVEERRRTKIFILKAVSVADERVREFHHEALHFYSEGKGKFAFWAKKQLPMKLKSLSNRAQAYAQEKSIEYLGDVRNSRLIKRSDGISEFFKNISDIEKGSGEINEVLPAEMQNDFYVETSPRPIEVTETKIETVVTTTVEEEPLHIVSEVVEAPVTYSPKFAKPKKASAPRKRPAAPKKKRTKILEVQHEAL